MKRRTRRPIAALLVALVVSLLITACSSASAPTSPAAQPTQVQPAAPAQSTQAAPAAAQPTQGQSAAANPAADTRRPIKIGHLASLTGPQAAPATDMRDGFMLYLAQKDNKLGGRAVEVISEDDEMKADVGLTKAKKLVEKDNVDLIAGVFHTTVGYAIADYVKAQKMPTIINNSGADDLTQRQFNPYIFRYSFSNSQASHPLGEYAYKKGYRTAALVASDFSAGYEWAGGFAKAFTDAGGKIVQEIWYPQGTADPSPSITAIKPNVDVVYAFQGGPDGLKFMQRWAEYGYKGKIPLYGVSSLTDDSILPQEGDAALGTITSSSYSAELNTPENKAFVEAFKAKYNRPATIYAANGYAGAQVLDNALEAVHGNIEDKDAFMRALEGVSINSVRGPIKLDKYHNVVQNIYVSEVQKVNGKLVNAVVDTYKEVSQFWKWAPEDFMKQTPYAEMKGKWASQ